MTAEPDSGWAVVEDDTILINTVSETRRAAVVNFLIVNRRLPISTNAPDADIFSMFENVRHGAELTMVTVSISSHQRMQ